MQGSFDYYLSGGASAAMGGSGRQTTSGTWTGGAGTWTVQCPSTATYTANASETEYQLTLTTSGGSGTTIATKQ
jgi:hypothetical protein